MNEKMFMPSLAVIAGILIGTFIPVVLMPMNHTHNAMDIEEKRTHFIKLKEDIQDTMRDDLKYRCCLEESCVYCIEKTPGHGEGAVCDCLKDIVEGVHPCGECIGEILEGHGNKYLSDYFARAIAEKVGEQHLPALKQIISEKYGIAVEDQL